jgi:pimeloyl-ACP methyl ester carboxylesterase
MFAMSPWALQLAQHGWRCVLMDLRGHGKSTGARIYFGMQEATDMSRLLDELLQAEKVSPPVLAVGHSYGAVTALRWRTSDPRVQGVVALSPYSLLADAVINISRQYSSWMPEWWLRAGLEKLPDLLETDAVELDTRTIIRRQPGPVLFVASDADTITPVQAMQDLFELAPKGSQLLIVADATHEAMPYFFVDLEPVLVDWLNSGREAPDSPSAD